jgi:hypothetical protein
LGRIITVTILLACFAMAAVNAQSDRVLNDSVSIQYNEVQPEIKSTKRMLIPKKAAMYSAVLPGLGQIYNRKAWKVPILYAGIGATAYGIWWNDKYYTQYRNAFIDLSDSDPNSNRHLDVLPPGADYVANKDYYDSTIEKKMNSYRRDRDLVIIVMVGVYVLNIIDANVDAHLSDFDISPDLSMNVSPVLMQDYTGFKNTTLGLSLTFNF